MNAHQLAWKGTTPAHKRELLEHSKAERVRLISEGKIKDGHIGLASTCIDIINTAEPALKHKDGEYDEWRALSEDATVLGQAIIGELFELSQDDWTSSDFEVVAVIILKTQAEKEHKLEMAVRLLGKGREKAIDEDNIPSLARLTAQLVRANILHGFSVETQKQLDELCDILRHHRDVMEPEDLTRLYRAQAEAAKHIAIEIAEKAGLHNQVIKAKAI